jgi:Sulfotransferase family
MISANSAAITSVTSDRWLAGTAYLPKGRILDVIYEQVVDDLEGQARPIVDHCGLPWDERCLAFYKSSWAVRTASAVQVRKPIYKSAIGRWGGLEDLLAPSRYLSLI